MTDENTEEVMEDAEAQVEETEAEFDLEEYEEQLEALHDNLDGIKEAGRNIADSIEENLEEDAGQERVMEAQRLMMKANLLSRRVENGDKNVVRGE